MVCGNNYAVYRSRYVTDIEFYSACTTDLPAAVTDLHRIVHRKRADLCMIL